MATMQLQIVTAEREVYSGEVNMVTAPGIEGELGILPNHAPFLTVLRPGELRINKDGEETVLAVSGGFLEVIQNEVTILADTAERAEEIDIQRAEEAMKRAQERIAAHGEDINLERAMSSLRRSQVRLKVARRRRRRPDGTAASLGSAPSPNP